MVHITHECIYNERIIISKMTILGIPEITYKKNLCLISTTYSDDKGTFFCIIFMYIFFNFVVKWID